MDTIEIVESQWPFVMSMMPDDLHQSAYDQKAFSRVRCIQSPEDLLRIVFCYCICDLSLRATAAWAKMMGLASVTDVAIMERIRKSGDWLGHLVLRWLQDRGLAVPARDQVVHVVDATSICAPGSEGTDWRLHMGLDLARLRIISVDITAADKGETLQRHTFAEGDIVLADRGYGYRADVGKSLDDGAHVVVRINWQNFPLQALTGADLDTVECLEILDVGEIGDWPVQLQTDDGTYQVRLIALRKTKAAAEKEQKRIRKIASRKGRTPHPKALRAAHFTYIITDLPDTILPAAEALELYRMRWQIENAFKRLKSILNLDNLRAQDPRICRPYLYAKMLGALIIDELTQQALGFFPWGYPILPESRQPRPRCADPV